MTQVPIDFDICAARHGGNPESTAAHASMKHGKAAMQERILDVLRREPATCERVEEITGWPHQSVSARLSEAKASDRIRVVCKGVTKSGRSASVYEVVG